MRDCLAPFVSPAPFLRKTRANVCPHAGRDAPIDDYGGTNGGLEGKSEKSPGFVHPPLNALEILTEQLKSRLPWCSAIGDTERSF
jgi:hypothetical protein